MQGSGQWTLEMAWGKPSGCPTEVGGGIDVGGCKFTASLPLLMPLMHDHFSPCSVITCHRALLKDV